MTLSFPSGSPSLRASLEELYERYHQREYLVSDPLELVWEGQTLLEREWLAVTASGLAYGNAGVVRKSVRSACLRLGACPAERIEALLDPSEREALGREMQGWYHRWNRGEDLVKLWTLIAWSWKQHGSVGQDFVRFLKPTDLTIESALNQFMSHWREVAEKEFHFELTRSFLSLLSRPLQGSACKRSCMLLRWMGRDDELDPGDWNHLRLKGGIRPSQLVIPIDTHTGRISQYLGLTNQKNLNWKMALEVTKSLRAIDPIDPTRFDFAICRLGILDLCQKRYQKSICESCSLLRVCRFAQSPVTL